MKPPSICAFFYSCNVFLRTSPRLANLSTSRTYILHFVLLFQIGFPGVSARTSAELIDKRLSALANGRRRRGKKKKIFQARRHKKEPILAFILAKLLISTIVVYPFSVWNFTCGSITILPLNLKSSVAGHINTHHRPLNFLLARWLTLRPSITK